MREDEEIYPGENLRFMDKGYQSIRNLFYFKTFSGEKKNLRGKLNLQIVEMCNIVGYFASIGALKVSIYCTLIFQISLRSFLTLPILQ